MLRNFLLVALGGSAGSVLRYGVGLFAARWPPAGFPVGTFCINITGSLIIGLLAGWSSRQPGLGGTGWLLLATGFCGGFTTFSAFSLETVRLLRAGTVPLAFLYILLSVAAGLAACYAGLRLGERPCLPPA